MPLSEGAVRHAKPREKPYKLADSLGLYLLVSPKGRYWRFDYRFASKRRTLALGVYPEIGLAKAREGLREAREQLRLGTDPSAAKQRLRGRAVAADSTVEAVGRAWFAKQKPRWADSHAEKVLLRLENDLFPRLGHRDIANVEPADLLAELRRVEQRGAVESAHRLAQYAGAIWRFAIVEGKAKHNPAADLRGALTAFKRGSYASIREPKRLGALLRTLDGYSGSFIVACALRLAPLLFLRPGELRGMQWSEDEGTDWRVPAERMKVKDAPHLVPVSQQARAILESLRPLTGKGGYVFTGRSGRPISDMTMARALESLGYPGNVQTVHGFRSTASTLLHEQGWMPQAIERQLAHAEPNKVKAAYNYAEHLPLRRQMMQAWADYLDTLRNEKSPHLSAGAS